MTPLELPRLVPAPGPIGGRVARIGPVVALVGPSDNPTAREDVFALCRDAATAPPEELVGRFSALATVSTLDACLVAAPAGGRRMLVVATGGARVVQGPGSVAAFLGDAPADPPSALVDLRDGMVAADGFVLLLDGEAGGVPVPTPSRPRPAAAEPAPVTDDQPGPPQETGSRRVEVVGVNCGRGHFNDADAQYCAVCGLAMVQSSHIAVRDGQPALGVLAFETGEAVPVRSDLVIGRAPESHDRVREGKAIAVVPSGDTLTLSRVHAEVRVAGRDVHVVDCGSTNGTFVRAAGDGSWRRLTAGEAQVVSPGLRVAFGQHGAWFEPPPRSHPAAAGG